MNGEKSALGQGIVWNLGDFDITVSVVSVSGTILASPTPQNERANWLFYDRRMNTTVLFVGREKANR